MTNSHRFIYQPLSQFSALQWHAMLQLRASIFVVEQHCFYLDPDDDDTLSLHVAAFDGHQLIGCARIIPPGHKSDEAWIGRFCLDANHRNGGHGRALFSDCLQQVREHYSSVAVALSAQCNKQSYYERVGFEAVGAPYDDAGIHHITMVLKP